MRWIGAGTAGTVGLLSVGLVMVWGATPVAAQEPAEADTSAFADEDEEMAEAAIRALAGAAQDTLSAAEIDSIAAAAGSQSFIRDWSHNPSLTIDADVRRVGYDTGWSDNLTLIHGQSIRLRGGYGKEDYRRQDKTVDRTTASFSYSVGRLLPFQMSFTGDYSRNSDRTVSTGGRENLNLRVNRSANLNLSRRDVDLGGARHDLTATGRISERTGENQNQRDESSDKNVNGAVRSRYQVFEGVKVATRVYGTTGEGTKRLGSETNPAYDRGDTLGAGVYYDRRLISGQFVFTRSNFSSQYLDFRRNENGLVDTLNLDPGAPRIVNETESKDAVTLEWINELQIVGIGLRSDLSRTTGQTGYAASLVGVKERLADAADVKLFFAVGRDSFALGYRYSWRWDDQRYGNATVNRGKKYDTSRDFDVAWYRDLFRNTDLTVKYHEGLSQSIAENQFDQNDRDRFDADFSVDMVTDWRKRFRTQMTFQYKQAQDVSIRSTRSANNATKDSYEIAPSYAWPLADWISLRQSFRVFIEYTDYHYDTLPQARRRDDYNKRGNLQTRIALRPSRRISVTITHNYTQRFNAERSRTDAAGRNFYQRTQEQTIGKIDLAFTFDPADWITLEGATYRSRDLKESPATPGSSTEQYAGQLWLGARLDQKIGRNAFTINGTVRRYLAYGPNVTDTSDDYWEANLSMDWKF